MVTKECTRERDYNQIKKKTLHETSRQLSHVCIRRRNAKGVE